MTESYHRPPDPADPPDPSAASPPAVSPSAFSEKENPYHSFLRTKEWEGNSNNLIQIKPLKRLKRALTILGDQYWLFVGICFVGFFLGSLVPFGVLLGPLSCGMFICYRNRMLRRPAKLEDLFKGFNYFKESLIAFFIHIAILFALTIPVVVLFSIAFFGFFAANDAMNGPVWISSFLALFLFYFLAIIGISAFAYVPITFAFPLIVDRGLKGADAIKVSWQTAKPMLFPLMMMYLIYGFFLGIASTMCYVPALMLLPLVIGAVFTLYEDIFGVNAKALIE